MDHDSVERDAVAMPSTPDTVRPTGAREREPALDVLRGFAMLGILLINIELMRGADFFRALSGEAVEPASAVGRAAHFLTGWLAAGKFISSFAIMFGIGAAQIAMRSWRAGRSPTGLLARRYALLIPLGLAHMLVLFPGDILFVYGVTGMLLLAFVHVRPRTALWWSGGILSVLLVLGVGLVGLSALAPGPPAEDPMATGTQGFYAERGEQAVSAFQEGGYGDVIVANAWAALLVQSSSLVILPWILALFLFGYAVGRSGIVNHLAAHRRRLRTAMITGFALGLPLNVATGMLGPMSMGAGLQPGSEVDGVEVMSMVGQIIGAPILAVGYLSALALLTLRIGPVRPLAAVGRMALTAYLLQSLLTTIVFAGFGLYDRLTAIEGLLVAFAVWVVLLVVCPLWIRAFRFGPVEWLWRTATYGRAQPLRAG